MNFSVGILAKNEENHLPRLLKSLAPFLDQGGDVVVQDGGSKDNTANVAKSFGCRVVDTGKRFTETITAEEESEFNKAYIVNSEQPIDCAGIRFFNFADARNHLAEQAKNDHITQPDADEAFTSLNVEAVCKEVATNAAAFTANFIWCHDEQGKPSGAFNQRKFYDRKSFHWNPQFPIHEALVGSGTERHLPEDIYRLEHFQNPDTTPGSYLGGLAWANFYHGGPRNAHYLARELAYQGRVRSAVIQFERHIAMMDWPVERAQSAMFLGDCYATLGDKESQLACYHRSFSFDSSRREPLLRLAKFYYENDDPLRVACYCAAALEIPNSGSYIYAPINYREQPHHFMYWALWRLGRKAEAKEHWQKAMQFNPEGFEHAAHWFKDV